MPKADPRVGALIAAVRSGELRLEHITAPAHSGVSKGTVGKSAGRVRVTIPRERAEATWKLHQPVIEQLVGADAVETAFGLVVERPPKRSFLRWLGFR